jgi:hypothetical protein
MNLADAFSQVDCTVGEAQIILMSLISNLRDSYPELHDSMQNDITNMKGKDNEPQGEAPPTTSTTTSTTTPETTTPETISTTTF